MFLRSHCISFVEFIVSSHYNVFQRFSGHTVLSSFSLLLVFALNVSSCFSGHTVFPSLSLLLVRIITPSNASPAHCIIFVKFIVSVRINVF